MIEIKHKDLIRKSMILSLNAGGMDLADDIGDEELEEQLIDIMGKTFEDLDKEVEIGISNGYSAEEQMGIVKFLFKSGLSKYI